MDLTFVLPLGLFNPVMERFAAHAGDLVPAPGHPDPRAFPPRQLFFGGRTARCCACLWNMRSGPCATLR